MSDPGGSSPHTRGAHQDFRDGRHAERIIPAYAGSTPASHRGSGTSPDHPRIRGEHLHLQDRHPQSHGSSPHTRGARNPARPHHRQHRIIPAYAGSTLEHHSASFTERDHPRIRGEHAGDDDATTELKGSSPHTRGARPRPTGPETSRRIIPAYAGSTSAPPPTKSKSQDHPRIRGEHVGLAWDGVKLVGSSPHTRGAQILGDAVGGALGIIPAYAGSTRAPSSRFRQAADHPRIRGEHSRNCDNPRASVGSSPHTRGALEELRQPESLGRIIPAYAGSTLTVCC